MTMLPRAGADAGKGHAVRYVYEGIAETLDRTGLLSGSLLSLPGNAADDFRSEGRGIS